MPRRGKSWRKNGWGGFVYGATAKAKLEGDSAYQIAQSIKHKFERERFAAGPCRELTAKEIRAAYPGIPVTSR